MSSVKLGSFTSTSQWYEKLLSDLSLRVEVLVDITAGQGDCGCPRAGDHCSEFPW